MKICATGQLAIIDFIIIDYSFIDYSIAFMEKSSVANNPLAYMILQNICWILGGAILLLYDLFTYCNRKY